MTIKDLLDRFLPSQEVNIYRHGGEYPDFEGYAVDAYEELEKHGILNSCVMEIETHRYDHVIYIRLFSKLERLTHE